MPRMQILSPAEQRAPWWFAVGGSVLSLLLVVDAWFSYGDAQQAANHAYDRSLSASVRGIAERNRADIPKLEQQIKPWGQEAELNDAKARHAAVIEQLKPKKKPEAAKPEGEVRMSRAGDLEAVFEGLDSRGLARKRALDSLVNLPDGEKIAYIDQNFWDILAELEDSNKVNIKC